MSDEPPKPNAGMPRWLVYGIAGKAVLLVAIAAAVVWWLA